MLQGIGSRVLGFLAGDVLLAAGLILATGLPAGASLGDCSQPVTDGATPITSDCLFILRAAVGQRQCSPACICDTNGADGLTASDALLCLQKAVGQAVTLACDCGGSTTSTSSSTTTSTLLGSCGLFENGEFELPVTTSPQNGWSFANNDTAGGWKSSGGNPGGFFRLNQAGQVETDPEVSQTVSGLTVGSVYRIYGEYRLYGVNWGDPSKPDAFAVRVEPKPGDHASSIVLGLPRPSPDPGVWTPFQVDFAASNATTTIAFVAERDGDDSSFEIDNLCLIEQ